MDNSVDSALTEEEQYLAELKGEVLEALSTCINCRFCLPACPLFDITTGEVFHGGSGITRSLYYALKWDVKGKDELKELREILYSCMMCKACETTCKNSSTGTKLLNAIKTGREILIEKMVGPMPEQKKVLESLEKYGNPYDMNKADREAWMKGLGAPQKQKDSKEVLLFIGCTAPHDDYAGKMARSLVEVLNKAEISYGILEDEVCCGHPALTIGENFVFSDIAEKNIEKFKRLDVKTIVTLSPHCFDTYKNSYPLDDLEDLEIMHYTQFINKLIQEKRITFKDSIDAKVTFHDPCYLGRHNGEYETPREILKAIPGVDYIEFRRNRENGLCCGGGGGRMFVDIETETDRMGKLRAREADEIGAEIIATTCPWCIIMLTDGIKTEDLDEKIEVKDICDILLSAM
jgi:Fe-S oxidoreductase